MTDPRNIAYDKKVAQEKKHQGDEAAPGADKTPQPGKKTQMLNHVSDNPKIPDEAAPVPDPPLRENIDTHLAIWRNRADYRLQEDALALLFREYCPDNLRPEHVLLKVCALNDFYGTNIYDKYSVTNHIVAMQIDSRLRAGDLTLVNELAKVQFKNGIRNVYSFATKYCSHHNSDKFPIFDQYVERMLTHFRDADNFAKFSKSSLRHYEEFVKVILEFQKFYGLSNFSLRQIDVYLWLAGKKAFPPSTTGA